MCFHPVNIPKISGGVGGAAAPPYDVLTPLARPSFLEEEPVYPSLQPPPLMFEEVMIQEGSTQESLL